MTDPMYALTLTLPVSGFKRLNGMGLVAAALSLSCLFSAISSRDAQAQDHAGQYEQADIEFGAQVYSANCLRCHAELQSAQIVEAALSYQPQPVLAGGEVELTAKDLDVGWYAEDKLDLSDVLSEAITLSWDGRYQCADVSDCELRTSTLLAVSSSDDKSHPAFKALRGFH